MPEKFNFLFPPNGRPKGSKMKTVNVKLDGHSLPAYAENVGDGKILVRVWDRIAGHYTSCHNLSENQEQYVRARTVGAKLPWCPFCGQCHANGDGQPGYSCGE